MFWYEARHSGTAFSLPWSFTRCSSHLAPLPPLPPLPPLDPSDFQRFPSCLSLPESDPSTLASFYSLEVCPTKKLRKSSWHGLLLPHSQCEAHTHTHTFYITLQSMLNGIVLLDALGTWDIPFRRELGDTCESFLVTCRRHWFVIVGDSLVIDDIRLAETITGCFYGMSWAPRWHMIVIWRCWRPLPPSMVWHTLAVHCGGKPVFNDCFCCFLFYLSFISDRDLPFHIITYHSLHIHSGWRMCLTYTYGVKQYGANMQSLAYMHVSCTNIIRWHNAM